MNSNNLKTTWWYRLLQVVYVLVYIFSAILIIIILYSETTKMVIDKERSMVSCHSGRNYTFKELNIRTTPLDYDTDKIVKTQCTPTPAEAIKMVEIKSGYQVKDVAGRDRVPTFREFLESKNDDGYELKEDYKILHNWHDFTIYSMVSVAILLIIMWLIRGTFLYIVTGISILKS